MRGEPTRQRRGQLRPLPSERAFGQLGQHPSITFAGDEGAQHRPAGCAQDITGDKAEFEIRRFQQLPHAIHFMGALLDQGRAMSRQITQVADWRGRDEARPAASRALRAARSIRNRARPSCGQAPP